jgi:hypothetical protein
METIEEDYADLKGVLPLGEYAELDNEVLGQLLRTLNPSASITGKHSKPMTALMGTIQFTVRAGLSARTSNRSSKGQESLSVVRAT